MSSLNFEIFNAPGAINVPEGELRVGTLDDAFVSYDFSVCSAVLIRDLYGRDFGFLHLYPGQDIEELNLRALTKLNGGSAKIIEGSDARYKGNLIERIRSQLGLGVVEFEEVETTSIFLRDRKFHTLFKPSKNEVHVARNSHSDQITLKAF